MSKSKRLLKEQILFAFVGGIVFNAHVGVLYLLKTNIGVYWDRVASFFCAIINNKFHKLIEVILLVYFGNNNDNDNDNRPLGIALFSMPVSKEVGQ